MSERHDAGDQVRLERLLPAPAEDVFAAWTDADSMSRWLSPTGRAEVTADVRVGAGFRVVMIGEDTEIEHTGEYLAIDPPRLLSFTWQSPYTGPHPSMVTVTLHPEGESTRLVLVHEALPPETAPDHEGGWGSIIENLASLLARPRSPGPTEEATA